MKKFLVLMIVLATGLSALACPTGSCDGNGTWVKVSTVSGTGSVWHEADGTTYQCQQPKPTPTPTPTPTNPSTSTSSSTSSSTSTSSATGGSSKSSATGGSATAVGGNATGGSIKNSGNSTLKNSGNSTVTVTPTQTSTLTNSGGNSTNTNNINTQGGTSSATNNGNNSNNSTTTINEAKIPVNTAYAPTALPTMGCFKGFGAGIQTGQVGASFGGGKVDENCERLEVARSYGIAGSWDAYCRVMITNKYSKEAGVTFDECMKRATEVSAPPPAASTAPQQPQVIVVTVPVAPTAQIMTPVAPVEDTEPSAPERPAYTVYPPQETKKISE